MIKRRRATYIVLEIHIEFSHELALDISSGVEVAKGIKDNNKIAEFLTEVYLSDRNN
jgi:phosphoribosylanthranilate isomerase